MFRLHPVRAALPLVLLALSAAPVSAQQLNVNSKAFEAFKDARDLIQSGKFDLAAEQLKAFTAAPPTDADYLLVQSKFGNSAFLNLRNVLRWHDNDAADKEARANAEAIIKKSE